MEGAGGRGARVAAAAAGARRDVMLSHALFSGWRKRQFATISTDSQNRPTVEPPTSHKTGCPSLNNYIEFKRLLVDIEKLLAIPDGIMIVSFCM